jgi:hypothetical protein
MLKALVVCLLLDHGLVATDYGPTAWAILLRATFSDSDFNITFRMVANVNVALLV